MYAWHLYHVKQAGIDLIHILVSLQAGMTRHVQHLYTI